MNIKYTVNQFYPGPSGMTASRRVHMRALTFETAKKHADRVRGGFVCALGSNVPVYATGWTY